MSYRLSVPFSEKDAAKKRGARWNPAGRYWYCTELTDDLRYWYRGAEAEEIDAEPANEVEEAPAGNPGDDPYAAYMTVSQANRMIANRMDAIDSFQTILVKGEVTNYKGPSDGNHYFDIKEGKILLSCVLWSSEAARVLNFELKSGIKVALMGRFRYYEKGGKVSLHVRRIADIGAGEANLAYLELRALMEAEGLFDLAHKKPIPKFPEKVGIITSKDGSAIKDIVKVATKRNPYIQLVLYHVNVQGKNAQRTILEGIAAMDTMGFDTIILSRGGGSDEERITFNDEEIARAVYQMQTPVVSAVGHEDHWSLADDVADKRVATPTEAAEECIPDIMTTVYQVRQLNKNITDNMLHALEKRKLKLNTQEAKLKGNDPVRKLKERTDRLQTLSEGLTQKMQTVVERKKNSFRVLLERLNGLSPTAKLVNGYGYISIDEKPVASIREVKKDDVLNVRIHDGQIVATVTETAGM